MDREGNILEKRNVKKKNLTKEKIERILDKFVGKQQQIPPMYSAIKVNGKKLYEYAREGKKLEVKPRQIEIYDIELKEIDIEKETINIIVYVSKGTYIRVLCKDIAEKLGELRIYE